MRPADQPRQFDGNENTLKTIAQLWPYIWPRDRQDLKARVVLALVFLFVSKILTVLVPYAYKWAVDALDGGAEARELPQLVPYLSVPVFFVVAYGVGRFLAFGFQQIRDAIFAKVAQNAVRTLGYETFAHLHRLSLRFHLERRTGGLSRVIERGVKGIEVIVRFTLLQTIPTIIEFALVAVVIALQFGAAYLVTLVLMMAAYLWFTVKATEWRIAIRRAMNDSDTEANSKAIDSLLNYETVKYFNNEEMESRRFDASMKRYETAAVKTYVSLAVLNAGQMAIFSAGMLVCMLMSAREVVAGTLTLGDFVMINALLIQLYVPLNFIGTVYREIKQALVDIEQMFHILERNPEVSDRPGAPDLKVSEGTISFRDVRFSYDSDRPILKGISFDVPAGKTVAIVGPSGAGKSTISRILFRFYDIASGSVTIDGRTSARSPRPACAAPSAWFPRTRCCSTTPCSTTSATGAPTPPTPRSRKPPRLPRSTPSSAPCRRATRRWWANAG